MPIDKVIWLEELRVMGGEDCRQLSGVPRDPITF